MHHCNHSHHGTISVSEASSAYKSHIMKFHYQDPQSTVRTRASENNDDFYVAFSQVLDTQEQLNLSLSEGNTELSNLSVGGGDSSSHSAASARIFKFAIIIPSSMILEGLATSCHYSLLREGFPRSEGGWWNRSYLAVLGALWYNSGLCFHRKWLEVGQDSILNVALALYEAAHGVLLLVFPFEGETLEMHDHHLDKGCSSIRTHTVGQACTVETIVVKALLAVLNNMCAIQFELVKTEEVAQLRREMRLVFLMVDPALVFANDDDGAYGFFLLNALFYADNKDMNVARAA